MHMRSTQYTFIPMCFSMNNIMWSASKKNNQDLIQWGHLSLFQVLSSYPGNDNTSIGFSSYLILSRIVFNFLNRKIAFFMLYFYISSIKLIKCDKKALFYRSVTIWSHLENFLPFWNFFFFWDLRSRVPALFYTLVYIMNWFKKKKKKKKSMCDHEGSTNAGGNSPCDLYHCIKREICFTIPSYLLVIDE